MRYLAVFDAIVTHKVIVDCIRWLWALVPACSAMVLTKSLGAITSAAAIRCVARGLVIIYVERPAKGVVSVWVLDIFSLWLRQLGFIIDLVICT